MTSAISAYDASARSFVAIKKYACELFTGYTLASMLAMGLLYQVAQQAKAQLLVPAPSTPERASSPKPDPLSRYYWLFLRHQKALDDLGARMAAEGKDGNGPRNDLQRRLGFTDAEYAPIREASIRLSAEIMTLNSKAQEVQRGEPILAVRENALKALAAEKEGDNDAVIAFLKQSLPPEKINALEAFAVHFFAPKKAPSQPSP